MPKNKTGTINHSLANKNLNEISGCELVIELMNIHNKNTPTENNMGCRHKFFGINGR